MPFLRAQQPERPTRNRANPPSTRAREYQKIAPPLLVVDGDSLAHRSYSRFAKIDPAAGQ
jgi:hypothetical protein